MSVASATSARSPLPLAVSAVLLTIFLWAAAFPAIKVGLQGFSPFALAAFRFFLASVALLALASAGMIRVLDRRDWPRLMLAGALGIAGYNLLLNFGQLTVSAGAASILINTHPIIAALLGVLVLHERVRWMGWVGILVSFLGVCTIATSKNPDGGLQIEAGSIAILAAAGCFAAHFVVQKPLLARYRAIDVASCMIWFGTILLLPFLPAGLAMLPEAPSSSVLAAVFLALGPGVLGYFAWAYALARFPVSRAASFLYLVVPSALVIAYFWVAEVPALQTVLGGVLVLAGVFVVSTLGRVSGR